MPSDATDWSYSETDLSGGGFALAYSSRTANATRSELGSRFAHLQNLDGMPLTLFARFAWVHDWTSPPSLNAAFQTLPGASFTVNGAAPATDSALASAGAELQIAPNWTLAGKFEAELASRSQTYSGIGTLRATWRSSERNVVGLGRSHLLRGLLLARSGPPSLSAFLPFPEV